MTEAREERKPSMLTNKRLAFHRRHWRAEPFTMNTHMLADELFEHIDAQQAALEAANTRAEEAERRFGDAECAIETYRELLGVETAAEIRGVITRATAAEADAARLREVITKALTFCDECSWAKAHNLLAEAERDFDAALSPAAPAGGETWNKEIRDATDRALWNSVEIVSEAPTPPASASEASEGAKEVADEIGNMIAATELNGYALAKQRFARALDRLVVRG